MKTLLDGKKVICLMYQLLSKVRRGVGRWQRVNGSGRCVGVKMDGNAKIMSKGSKSSKIAYFKKELRSWFMSSE